MRIPAFLALTACLLVGGCSTLATSQAEPGTLPPTTTSSTTTTTEATFEPTERDFEIDLKVTDKECFGSAGCNVTFEAGVAYVGSSTLPETGTVDVTYRLKGVEDEYISTIEVEDGKYAPDSGTVSVRTSKTKLVAEVTEVEYTP